MKRILGFTIALMTALLPMSFTSCGSDDTPITAIALNIVSVSNATVGDIDTIVATITPTSDATNPHVVWTHTVDSALQLTAKEDTCFIKYLRLINDTIVCSAAEGNGVKASCFIYYEAEDDDDDDVTVDSLSVDSL